VEDKKSELISQLEDLLNRHFDNVRELPKGKLEWIVTKAFVAQVNDMRIIVQSNNHPPAHFHVTSKQRNLNVRIDITTFEPLEGEEASRKDIQKIKILLTRNPSLYKKLLETYDRFNISKNENNDR